MTIRHSYRFQPLQIGLAYLSPKTRCVLCTFNTLIHLTIRYLYKILSLKNGLTKLFYFEHPTCKGKSTNKFDNTIIYYDFLREDSSLTNTTRELYAFCTFLCISTRRLRASGAYVPR